MNYLIKNAKIVNEGKIFNGSVWIKDRVIEKISDGKTDQEELDNPGFQLIDAHGKYLLPGVIDDQVHFRDPGLTYKADIYTESKAAVAGGITSFMEMPNTIPNTLTQDLLEKKYQLAAKKSLANFSFYMGASNDNLNEIVKTDPKTVCGIKVFMGSSTGNMLVDDAETLQGIFRDAPTLVAVHCEDENTIIANTKLYKEKYGEDIPIKLHPEIRSAEACYKSSSLAVGLAQKFGTRLHVLHLSSAAEMGLFRNDIPLKDKKITAEVCVHHLWFSEDDYDEKGTFIKWNPAIKKATDREGLWQAMLDDKLDVIATDHAPHTLGEKQNSYFKAPSGGPLVQHSLTAMLESYHNKKISLEKIAEKMCHAPADCFSVDRRGYIREGYSADLVLVDLQSPWTVETSNVLYKCGWSPFEGQKFNSKVTHTFVNGNLVYSNGIFDETEKGHRLTFYR
ncbi:MAG: dihydroorotase [Bacteroidetes bacterium 4484_276]|nr:MAG: dihydroorotase [Bacteroidetes bacterium 4484_276]OYT14142.1 MAG: dihydroorotase [Bacteroidetes bacterium 4572_114]